MKKETSKILFTVYLAIAAALVVYFISPAGGTWFYLHHIRWVYLLIFSFSLSSLLTFAVRFLSWKWKILDYPDDRKVHPEPVPVMGGTAVFIAFLAVAVRNLRFSSELVAILVAGFVIFIVGLIDDIRGLPAKSRLLAQILAALILIKGGIVISVVPHIPLEYTIEVLLTIFWVVGITNAVNFLDGIDGLVGGMAAINSFCFLVIAVLTGQMYLGFLTSILIGVCLGFLPYNFKPASIFLGDSGSTFLGFTLAGLAVMGTWTMSGRPIVAVCIPVLILGVVIFDMIYITVSRFRNKTVKTIKEWLEYVGRDHFHHRLLNLGLNEVQTVCLLFAVNLCLGIGAVVLRDAGSLEAVLLLLQAFIIFCVVVALMLAGRRTS